MVGRILLRQEGRFYMVDESGTTRLFVAAHDFGPDDDVLTLWQRKQTPIALRYRNAPGLLAFSALEASPAHGQRSPPHLNQEPLDDGDTEQA